jgi:hypothetical protein
VLKLDSDKKLALFYRAGSESTIEQTANHDFANSSIAAHEYLIDTKSSID